MIVKFYDKRFCFCLELQVPFKQKPAASPFPDPHEHDYTFITWYLNVSHNNVVSKWTEHIPKSGTQD
jgi:hypothetical protein